MIGRLPESLRLGRSDAFVIITLPGYGAVLTLGLTRYRPALSINERSAITGAACESNYANECDD